MVSALGLKLVHSDVVRMAVRLTGAVFVAFAAKLAFSRQMSAMGRLPACRFDPLPITSGKT